MFSFDMNERFTEIDEVTNEKTKLPKIANAVCKMAILSYINRN